MKPHAAVKAGKTLNPYQGLKLKLEDGTDAIGIAGKTLNPYQGLKQVRMPVITPGVEREKP